MNKIVTPYDVERWPLLTMPSTQCPIPLSHADEQAIKQMDEILEQLGDEAAGLAAVQIGYPRRIFLLRNGIDENGKPFNNAYINPIIVKKSKETQNKQEACLSLPGFVIRTKRPKSITIQFFDIDGEVQTQEFKGFWSQVVSHEISHLEGRLIVQESNTMYATKIKKSKQLRARIKRAKKAKRHLKAIGR